MWAWVTTAWTAVTMLVKYGPAAVDVIRAVIALVGSIQRKIEEKRRHDMVDEAGRTRDPSQLEDRLRGSPTQ